MERLELLAACLTAMAFLTPCEGIAESLGMAHGDHVDIIVDIDCQLGEL